MKLLIFFRQMELENMGQPDSTAGNGLLLREEEGAEDMNELVPDENFTWESLLLENIESTV